MMTPQSKDLLRTGDEAIITFQFAFRAEYIIPGTTLLFCEVH
jgi:GTPase